MEKYIPLNKRSKKEQKKYYSQLRQTWGEISPVTRSTPNGRAYDRNKLRQSDRRNGRNASYEAPAVLFCSKLSGSVLYSQTKL